MKLLSSSRIGGRDPSFLYIFHIDAQAQGAVIDAHQLVVAEEAATNGIYQFLVADGEKLPFAYRLDALYLGRRQGGLLF